MVCRYDPEDCFSNQWTVQPLSPAAPAPAQGEERLPYFNAPAEAMTPQPAMVPTTPVEVVDSPTGAGIYPIYEPASPAASDGSGISIAQLVT